MTDLALSRRGKERAVGGSWCAVNAEGKVLAAHSDPEVLRDWYGGAEGVTVRRREKSKPALSVREPSAWFSECGRFRWLLRWPTGLPNDRVMLCCAANPSKAGQIENNRMRSDPTVSRMRGLALELGYGWIWMVNARSFVATHPSDVPPDPEAIGVLTDSTISESAKVAELVVVAYGKLAGARAGRVLQIIREAGKVPHAIALTQDGTPRHPRGVPKSARPFPLPKGRE